MNLNNEPQAREADQTDTLCSASDLQQARTFFTYNPPAENLPSAQPSQEQWRPHLTVTFVGQMQSWTSTALYVTTMATDAERFYLELHSETSSNVIGYAQFDRATSNKFFRVPTATYELTELLPATFPTPSPLVTLSGCLWPRRRVLSRRSPDDRAAQEGI